MLDLPRRSGLTGGEAVAPGALAGDVPPKLVPDDEAKSEKGGPKLRVLSATTGQPIADTTAVAGPVR